MCLVRTAHFPFARDPRGFDFAAQPSPDPGRARKPATARSAADGEAVLLPGSPGVSKTHPTVALGQEAIRRGHPVLFVSLMLLGISPWEWRVR